MICVSLTKLPCIKCDNNGIFFLKKEDSIISEYAINCSLDINRTIYDIDFTFCIVSDEEHDLIVSSDDDSDPYCNICFEFPDEETAMYFKLKYVVDI